jgi:Holliday junction resolvase RusA-like endonuclease
MVTIKIKPLSVNEAYRGRRFATPELRAYKEELAYLLPKKEILGTKLMAKYVFGMSSKASDVDNCIKAFQDTLAEVYGFNDKIIYKIIAEKIDVQKGQEFVQFELSTVSLDIKQ